MPASVLDVGAAFGTEPLYRLFPDAKYLLIEPLREYEEALKALTTQLGQADYIIAAATSSTHDVAINVHPDLVGSSLYKEDEGSDVNGVERLVPGRPLDELCATYQLKGPYLLKIDTQGAEIEVLKGAAGVLQQTEMVILEVSLFEFFKGGPQLYDCVQFMKAAGFAVYDLFEPQYRMLDGAMSQIDIAFVREAGKLRKHHVYATSAQRQEQNRRFLRDRHQAEPKR